MSVQPRAVSKLLVANRSEIAIRAMRAAAEMGITTVAIYSQEDRFALHRFKSDESYLVGQGKKPIAAYLDIDDIIRVAVDAGVDAIHPGYGFLSENPDFADACARAGIIFIGPSPDVMRTLGNKVAARKAAEAAGVPVMPASGPLPADIEQCKQIANSIGYPFMLKASWGGGGRGMRVLENEADLLALVDVARREAQAAFGNDEVYLEKLVRNARHVEVQILGDLAGNVVHLFERDCSMQRRNQKVVERAPAPYLDEATRQHLCDCAMRLARQVGYSCAGTVEFLLDADTNQAYFIEVNPRIQVEHTVTEEVTGVDLIKAQIRLAQGHLIGTEASGVPAQENIQLSGFAVQCRVTTEDPENGFTPDYGRIEAYRSAAGFGIRLDAGTAYPGAVITPYYDSLLVKVTAWSREYQDSIAKMDRALREFRVRGVTTNLNFLVNLINHPSFAEGTYSTRFIDQTPELYKFAKKRDRASRLLRFVAEVSVNGHPDALGRPAPASRAPAPLPSIAPGAVLPGSKDRLDQMGAAALGQWMRSQQQVLITDTTMRDAHQSLLATRMRTQDMLNIAPYYASLLPDLFSLECWGGATFDVSMRFLQEDPFGRLHRLRKAVPNILLQMLLRGANGVGYTSYPDNVVKFFVRQAAECGVDVFRVFDSLNWVENMRVAMDAVIDSGKFCQATLCYTGNMLATGSNKYNLNYYVQMAKELEKAGAHGLAIKDMAGVARPVAIKQLVTALRQEVGLPIAFHTHDTSGIGAASILAAIEAGVDSVDAAMDAFSGLTSQPNLGSINQALRDTDRATGLAVEPLQAISDYWEGVRKYYTGYESEIRSGTADVYRHAMPGGQYTNLREQARSLGIEHRWDEVAEAYAQVNQLFGDIVKVTPTSKVVGDMALMMVTQGLTPEDVQNPTREINFPESVVQLFRGDLGQPPGGFPVELSKKVLKGEAPRSLRPGAELPDADLAAIRAEAAAKVGYELNDWALATYLMYPKVFTDFAKQLELYGDVSILSTPVFFYGMELREEFSVSIEKGKSLMVRLLAISEPDLEGFRKVFFELNGQQRIVKVLQKGLESQAQSHPKAEEGNPHHVAAPMPGLIISVSAMTGQKVERGDALVSIEAMKMESIIRAERAGVIKNVLVKMGTVVDAKDLLVEFA